MDHVPAPPRSPDESFTRAIAAFRQGRFGEAEELCRLLLKHAPGHPDVLHLLGIICGQTGRQEEAIGLIRRAIGAVPGDPAFHGNLGTVFMQLKRWEDASGAFGQALAIKPHDADAAFSLGLSQMKLGRLESAVDAFRRTIVARPDHAMAMAELAGCLGQIGKVEEALALQQRAIELLPGIANFHGNLGFLLLKRGAWERAIAEFDRAVTLEPWHVPSLAGKGIALFEGRRDAEASRLIDLDGLIETDRLVPSGTDAATLAEKLCAHDSAIWQRSDTTTRGGLQTASLHADPDPTIRSFVSALTARIGSFVASRRRDPTRPFLARLPAEWRCSVWATILYREGHQMPHLHPRGWLSGVYYLEVPERILSADNADQQGWIEFGMPGYGIAPARPPVVRRIRPEPDRIIFFPSYMFHRTIPFEAEARRISIAFDLIPTSWQSD